VLVIPLAQQPAALFVQSRRVKVPCNPDRAVLTSTPHGRALDATKAFEETGSNRAAPLPQR